MRLVAVTGMHRSGTSLVTRVLNLLGVELGPDSAMMAATADNPRGYWEAEVLSDLDNDVIEYLGGRWHRLPPFPDGWEDAPELEPFRRTARSAIDELFGDAEVAGFKDPRTSLLLPFWRTVLAGGGRDGRSAPRQLDSVLVVRDPDEVIGSVVKRDGFEPEKAASLWTDHTVAAYVHDPERLVVVYEQLLAEPVAGARAIAEALGLPAPDRTALDEVASFADPSLRRNRGYRAPDGPEVRAARDVHHLLLSDASDLGGVLGLLWQQRNQVRLRDLELRQQGHELAIHKRDLATASRERDQLREQLHERSRELTRRRSEAEQLQRQVERWRNEYERLRGRRVVKLALSAVEPLRPVVRKVRELKGDDPTGGRLASVLPGVREPKPEPHVPASEEDAERLAATFAETAPGSDRVSGPLVSVLVLNRDGAHHLDRLLPGLASTTYRDVELIVVDNASSDDSVERIRAADLGMPVTIIENEQNASFSHGNNQAFAEASGEYVLLLNNDIEPAVPGWLGHLVDTLEERDAVAVGARLVYPRRPGLKNAGDTVFPDLTLQHRGVHFDGGTDGVPRGRNLGAGDDPLSAVASAVTEVPAATAACLLVRADTFRAVGGFTEGYRYGTEDVDLCLKLRQHGPIVYDGGAVLWHHEYGTQNAAGREQKRLNRIHNREQFVDRWGPQLHREVTRDRLLGTGAWSETPLHIAVTLTKDDVTAGWGDYYTAHEFGDALREQGFRVSYAERYGDRWYDLDDDVDVLVALLDAIDLRRVPKHITTVAWIRNWTDRWTSHPWFEDYDIVLASSEPTKEHIERVSSKRVARIYPLATNPDRMRPRDPDPDLAAEMVFIGNYWEKPRDIIPAVAELPAGVDLHVHGANWHLVESVAPYDRGPLDYDRLPIAYSSAKIVIDDTAGPTKPWGALNSRVFDALAAGAYVISDNTVGVAEIFGDDFPTWETGADLAAHLEDLRADEAACRARAARYRDVVLAEHTYARRAEQLRDILLEHVDATRATIAIGVPNADEMARWGDTHYARDIQRQLERAGIPTRVALLPEWTQHHTGRDDVLLHLFGLSELTPRSSQLTALWNISHPERVTPGFVEAYDVAFIASRSFAAELAGKVSVPVHPLPQATEPSRFKPVSGGPPHQLLFVANSRKVRRRIVDDLTRAEGHELDAELAIYGAHWTRDLVDPRHVAGDHVPNTDLARYYSAAEIVLNDHWDDMREHGFLSNRLYDALACGALVVSDHVDGIEEEFDGTVVTYRTPEELHEKIRHYLSHPVERRELAERGRRVVLERHTFEHRVATMRTVLEPLVAERPRTVLDPATGRA